MYIVAGYLESVVSGFLQNLGCEVIDTYTTEVYL